VVPLKTLLLEQVVLAAEEMVMQTLMGVLVLQIQAAVEAVALEHITAVQAVQALSFFATPAQFNISLVAQ